MSPRQKPGKAPSRPAGELASCASCTQSASARMFPAHVLRPCTLPLTLLSSVHRLDTNSSSSRCQTASHLHASRAS